MKTHLAACALASVFAVGCSSYDQTATTVPPPTATTAPEVAMIGCLQREADYRAIQDEGKGGVFGTGLGVANEYVLADAVPVEAASDARPASNSGTTARTFALTGHLEGDLASAVGRIVEVVGVAEDAAAADRLPTFRVTLSHEVRDFCPRR